MGDIWYLPVMIIIIASHGVGSRHRLIPSYASAGENGFIPHHDPSQGRGTSWGILHAGTNWRAIPEALTSGRYGTDK